MVLRPHGNHGLLAHRHGHCEYRFGRFNNTKSIWGDLMRNSTAVMLKVFSLCLGFFLLMIVPMALL